MYLYCGKKMYTEDTLRINGIIAGRKELIEYVLNSPYSLKKYNSYCISPYALLDKYIMENLVHSVMSYFNTREYSASNVERLQLKILNDLDEHIPGTLVSPRRGTLVSPYVIREICKFYRII